MYILTTHSPSYFETLTHIHQQLLPMGLLFGIVHHFCYVSKFQFHSTRHSLSMLYCDHILHYIKYCMRLVNITSAQARPMCFNICLVFIILYIMNSCLSIQTSCRFIIKIFRHVCCVYLVLILSQY